MDYFYFFEVADDIHGCKIKNKSGRTFRNVRFLINNNYNLSYNSVFHNPCKLQYS